MSYSSQTTKVSSIERILFKTIIRREFIEDKLADLDGDKLTVMRKRLQLRKEKAKLIWKERELLEKVNNSQLSDIEEL